MTMFHAVRRLSCAVLALCPAFVAAASITGTVSDLKGNPLTGACVALTTSGTSISSDAKGGWSLVTTGVLTPVRSAQELTPKHLFLDGGHVRLQFKGVDGLGRTSDLPLAANHAPGTFSAPRSEAAAPDTLVFAWKGRVRAKIAASAFVSGAIQMIDTSAATAGGACLTCLLTGTSGVCSDTVAGTNIVTNSTFDAVLTPWMAITEAPGAEKATIVAGQLQLVITNDGAPKPWGCMLMHQGIPVVGGKSYRLSVDARALAPFNLIPSVQTNTDPPGEYFIKPSWPLTTTMKTFTIDFKPTVAQVKTPTSVIQFSIGNQGATTLFFDNVQLIEKTTP